MSLGEVLDRTFNLYKQNFMLFVGITFLPFLLLFIFQVGMAALQLSQLSEVRSGTPANFPTNAIFGLLVGGLVGAIVYLLLAGAAQAATIFAVSDLYLGREASVRGSYARVGGKALRVIVILLLVGLAVGVGCLLLIIPGIILLCRLSVSVPVSMLEDSKSIPSIERSMELTKGHGWQIFLIYLLLWVVGLVIGFVLEFPFSLFGIHAARAHETLSFGTIVLQNLASFVAQVLAAPIGTIAFSLMYYNLRVRKEAFDVQHLMASLGTPTAPGASPAI
jgi:hypothetical protein